MPHKPQIPIVLFLLVLLLSGSAWGVPITGFLEGTAANGWRGSFGLQLADGTIVTGVNQITGLLNTFQSLPLVTSPCTASVKCSTVTNLLTSSDFTMSSQLLDLSGSATRKPWILVVGSTAKVGVTRQSKPDCSGTCQGNWGTGRHYATALDILIRLQQHSDLIVHLGDWRAGVELVAARLYGWHRTAGFSQSPLGGRLYQRWQTGSPRNTIGSYIDTWTIHPPIILRRYRQPGIVAVETARTAIAYRFWKRRESTAFAFTVLILPRLAKTVVLLSCYVFVQRAARCTRP